MSENRPTTQPTIIPVPEPVERASWKHRLYAAAVYYPSFFWNVWNGRLLKRWQWWTEIDQDVVLGAVPFRRDIGKMVQLGVKAIVNTCEEFPGHTQLYQELWEVLGESSPSPSDGIPALVELDTNYACD